MASHQLPTISKSALLLSPCIAWAGPTARWYDESLDTDTRKRDLGIETHEYIDNNFHGKEGIYSDEAIGLGHAGYQYLVQVLGARADNIYTEVCVGVNWSTQQAETFPLVKGRNYPAMPGWQFGTADVVAHMKDGSLYVGDWKTGGTDGAKEQLMSLAWAFQRALNGTSCELRKVRIACLSLLDGKCFPDEREVSQDELDAHADAMRFAWEDIGVRNQEVPGIHCSVLYCPHLAYCKAVGGMVLEASEGPKGLLKPENLVRKYTMTDKPTSSQEAGYVAERVTAAKRQLNYYTDALKAYVRGGGRVLSGNYEWFDKGNGFRWHKQ